MGNRLSQIITRTGDKGSTMLGDGNRISKSDIRIHCLGDVDELNSQLGLARSHIEDDDVSQLILQIQHDLFDVGAELSQPGKILIDQKYIDFVEQQAERLNAELNPLKEFIIPGGHSCVAQLHLARTMCRRVERGLVALLEQQSMNIESLRYLNRLSDLLFIVARYIAKKGGYAEVFWQSKYSRQV
jgi:cob(I)alamin adenosyltransferase